MEEGTCASVGRRSHALLARLSGSRHAVQVAQAWELGDRSQGTEYYEGQDGRSTVYDICSLPTSWFNVCLGCKLKMASMTPMICQTPRQMG